MSVQISTSVALMLSYKMDLCGIAGFGKSRSYRLGNKYKKDLDAALRIVQILIHYSCSFKKWKS